MLSVGLASVGLCLAVRIASAGSEILVVDPKGNPVPSEIFRVDPRPRVHVGLAPDGHLALSYVCTPDMGFEAVPNGNFGEQKAYCDPAGMVRIEVTPAYMLAQLKSNLKGALAANNHAAAAQIATELAARVRVENGTEASYYRNLAVAESARVVSPAFNHDSIWEAGNVGSEISDQYSAGTVSWSELAQSTDLLTCAPHLRSASCKLVPTPQFQGMLDNTVSHPGGAHVTISPRWLQNYSHVTTGRLMFDNVPKWALELKNPDESSPRG